MSQRGYDPALDGSYENYYTNVNPMMGQSLGLAPIRPRLGIPYGGRSNYRSQLPIKRSPPPDSVNLPQQRFRPDIKFGVAQPNIARMGNRQDLQRIGDLFGRLGGNQQRPIYESGPAELRNQVGDFFNNQNLSSRSPSPVATPAVEPDFTVFDPYGDGGPFDRRFPQPPSRFPQPPRNRFPQPQPPSRFPRPPGRPPGRFPQPSPMPFPSPGRKGQRNRPQPGGYYPQPPSSPNYPGERFPSPGRKGNRSSYHQPRTPFGYGQIQDMSYRFGGAGVPQNIYGFQDPHYSPYQPPSYSPNPYDPGGQPGGPSDDGRVDDGYYQNPPMTGGGGTTTNPGGKGGSMRGSPPFVPPYMTDVPNMQEPIGGGYAGGFNQQIPSGQNPYEQSMGGGFGGGFGGGGGKGMNSGGRTAFPNSDILSSYINR